MIYRVSIVGAGIGAQHLAAFSSLPDKFEVRHVCDLNTERAAELASRYSGVGVLRDLSEVLSDSDVDIVDICLPPHLHFETCMAALDAGKIVVCEKPLVTSLAEADLLADRARSTNGLLFPVFQYRFGLGAAQLRALIDAGLAGRCYAGSLETHWNRQADYYDNDWRGTWAGEQGGAVLGHAIHIHDLLTSFLGPVGRVYAELATRVNEIEVEDCAAITLKMESGALITSSVTLGSAEDMSRLRLNFEGFTVESDNSPYAPATEAWSFTARNPTKQEAINAVLSSVGDVRASYSGMFEALADALDGASGAEVTLEDGRRSLELVTAIYASARENRPIDLPIGKEIELYDGWVPTLPSKG